MINFEDREPRRKTPVIGSMVDFDLDAGSRRGRPRGSRETKKRISLAVLPSLYKDIQKIAYMQRISVSDLVGSLLELYREQHEDELTRYQRLKELEADHLQF